MAPHPCIPWTLRSIARLERAGGVRPPRITEPGFAHWHRIRRRLGWRDLIALLHEDLASAFPLPFELAGALAQALTEAEAERLVHEAATADGGGGSAGFPLVGPPLLERCPSWFPPGDYSVVCGEGDPHPVTLVEGEVLEWAPPPP
jgi:hypothetical protein